MQYHVYNNKKSICWLFCKQEYNIKKFYISRFLTEKGNQNVLEIRYVIIYKSSMNPCFDCIGTFIENI